MSNKRLVVRVQLIYLRKKKVNEVKNLSTETKRSHSTRRLALSCTHSAPQVAPNARWGDTCWQSTTADEITCKVVTLSIVDIGYII
jgi:hypothetical protein